MRCLRAVIACLVLGAPLACGDDDHEEDHDFATYLECYDHHIEEGLTEVGATTECDGIFELSHDDSADCQADHAADVTDGVAQAAIDTHCDAEFPPA